MSNLHRVFLMIALAWGAFSGGPSLAATADGDAGSRLKNVQQTIERERKQRDALKAKAEELNRQMAVLRGNLVAAAKTIHDYESEMAALESRMSELADTEARMTRRLAGRRQQFADVLMALQRLARHPPEAMIAQPMSLSDTVRGAILLRTAVPELEQRAARLRRDLDDLARTREDLNGQRSLLTGTAEKLRQEQKRLEGLFARKAEIRKEAMVKSRKAAKRAQALAKEAKSIKDLLARLKAERKREQARLKKEERRRQAVARAAEVRAAADAIARAKAEAKAKAKALAETRKKIEKTAARIPPPAKIILKAPKPANLTNLANLAKPASTNGPISRARGRMPYPVVGRVVGRYGQTMATGLKRKGIAVETRAGAQVVAPFDGEVVFAGPFRGYGQLLIIDHGEGYHSLLAGMAGIDSVIGQWLVAGEPVGLMGRPANGNPALYVELRKDGQPINPQPWLAARNSKVNG